MRSIGIGPPRQTDPRSGEGHPAPATKQKAGPRGVGFVVCRSAPQRATGRPQERAPIGDRTTMHSIGKSAETNRSAKRGGRNPVPATKQKGRIALWGPFSFSLPVGARHAGDNAL